MLSRLSIRTKLIALVSLLLIALTAMGAFAVIEMRAINASAQDIKTSWLPSIRLVGELRTQSARYRAVLRDYLTEPDEAYFWGTHAGAELDLLLVKQGRRIGLECKRMDAPRLTASMQTALADLALDHLTVIYPGDRPYPLGERVTVVPLTALATGAQAVDAKGLH